MPFNSINRRTKRLIDELGTLDLQYRDHRTADITSIYKSDARLKASAAACLLASIPVYTRNISGETKNAKAIETRLQYK